MGRALLILRSGADRQKAVAWIGQAPDGTRVEFKWPVRSIPQNDRMWAMLTDVSVQLDWQGQHYQPADWKDYFMHALRRARWMPDEDGGMVPVGMRTSDLSKDEMSDLLELIAAFGARHGVQFSDPADGARKGELSSARDTGRRPENNTGETVG